jgi:Cys-tRNA(Pro)/Cys-tRNA(Cys) deacylase
MKTNAIRILESKCIPHSVVEYSVDEDHIDAISVANKIGFEPERVFKTLVTRNEKNEINVFLIPGNYELDLKKASNASGFKKIEMIKVAEIQPLTGYIRGGCSPIGMKKNYPTFIDNSAEMFDNIAVSAGLRGIQIILSPNDLTQLVNGIYADLI